MHSIFWSCEPHVPLWSLESRVRICITDKCFILQAERKAYEVVVQDGKLVYKKSGEDLHTGGGPKDAKWIFVLGTSKIL